MIATAVDPAAEGCLHSLVACTEFAAGVSTEHGAREGGCRKYAVSVCRIPAFFRSLLQFAADLVADGVFTGVESSEMECGELANGA